MLAPGAIAAAFVAAGQRFTGQHFVAVGSRSLERATAFARATGIDFAHGSYQAVVERPDVDVVYVAAPASEHVALGLLAIQAGKHVLIEKPLATSAEGGRLLVDAARSAGVFLMEGLWSRYLPQSDVIRQLVADGVLGDIEVILADHGQALPKDPASRSWRPDLGGGAIAEIGIYPLALSSEFLGRPTAISAFGGVTSTGVDAYAAITLEHPQAAYSSVNVSMITRTPIVASIAGSAARIDIGSAFHVPAPFTLIDPGGDARFWPEESGMVGYDGLSWEADAVASYIGAGRLESPIHSLDETVSILETIDEAVRQVRAGNAAVTTHGTDPPMHPRSSNA